MSAEPAAAVVRKVFDAYNAREFDRVVRLLAVDFELVNVATGEVFHGPNGYLQYARGWAAAFPDSRIEVLEMHEGSRDVAVEFIGRGTQTGTLVGPSGQIPPTGRPIELRFCDLLRVEEGRVQRWRSYFDSTTLMRQMGLVPDSPLHVRDRRAPLGLYAVTEGSTQQRNEAVVHRYLQEAVNRKDLSAAADLCAPNLIWHGGTMGEIRDFTGFVQVLSSFFAAFPDLHVEVKDTFAEGDRVAVRTVTHGTHQGDFQGVPPTGRHVTVSGTSLFRVVNGRIVEEWWQQDLLDLMRQLDAVPAMVRLAQT